MLSDKFDVEDYHKRYSGTYLQFHDKNNDTLFTGYVHKIYSDENLWNAKVEYSVGNFRTYTNKEIDIVEEVPAVGTINYNNGVIIATRYPERQWKRGICTDNFKISNPLYTVTKSAKKYPVLEYPIKEHKLSLALADAIYNNTFFSTEEALKKISSFECLGAAVNNNFWFSPSWYNKSIVLWYNSTIVGEYKTDKLYILEKGFEQEINDFFRSKLCLQ